MEMGSMGNSTTPTPMPMPMPMPHKMMMHMTFFWGSRVEILFSGFPGDRGVGIYLLALLVVFVLSLAVELLSHVPVKNENRIALTGLTAVRQLLSYVVMLAVMSFNVGVLLVAVVGHAIGFLIFGTGILFKGPGDQYDELGNSKC